MAKPRDYAVGFGKPPAEHRFKPGQSGNPTGRPKGARSMGEEVRAALRATVTITENGKKRRIPVIEAAVKRLVQRAVAAGDLRAIQLILKLGEAYPADVGQAALAPDDRALIAEALAQLARELNQEDEQ